MILELCNCAWDVPGVEELPHHVHAHIVTVKHEDDGRTIEMPMPSHHPAQVVRPWHKVDERDEVHIFVPWKELARELTKYTSPPLADALERLTRTVINETEGRTFGKPGYDITLDHLHDEAQVAREELLRWL